TQPHKTRMGHPAEALYVEAARYRVVAKVGSQTRNSRLVDTEDTMSPRTIFLSKLLGLYCVVVGLAMFVHSHATIKALVQCAPALYIAGIIALAIGLAMVLGHNVWSGGVLPVVVTLVGWLSLIKGVLILFLPAQWIAACYLGCGHQVPFLYLKAAITLILGAYLTYGGFTSKSQ